MTITADKADMVFAIEGHTFKVFFFDGGFHKDDSFRVNVTNEVGSDDWYVGHTWGDMDNRNHAVVSTARAWIHNASYREVARIAAR